MSVQHSIFLNTGFGGEFAGLAPEAAFEGLVNLVKVGDEVGFDTGYVLDHFQTMPPSQAPVFECFTTVAALLRETSRMRIGQLVTATGYRNPALAAKMASTLDVLGRGRFTYGVGAGWYEADYLPYGYQFPGAGTRLQQLEEAVQIILSLWQDGESTFEGRHHTVRGAVNQPKGLQTPHIPLLIAGAGEKVTLRIVARYADLCNVIDSPEGLAKKFAVLRHHCDEAGRDYDSIRRTTTSVCAIADTDAEAQAMVPPGLGQIYPGDWASYCLIGSPETIRQRLAEYQDAGVEEIAISFVAPDQEAALRRYASEVIAA
jgi:F420-dependent oxidoreductase-like protein